MRSHAMSAKEYRGSRSGVHGVGQNRPQRSGARYVLRNGAGLESDCRCGRTEVAFQEWSRAAGSFRILRVVSRRADQLTPALSI